jgi:hypothetical protein
LHAATVRLARNFLPAVPRFACAVFCLGLTHSGSSADEGITLNLGAEQVSQTWNLGEHHAQLSVSLSRTARVWLAGDRVWISVSAANPELTSKLAAAFRSTAKNGYTVIARTGSSEISLGSAREFSLGTDDRKAVWVRATIRLQQRNAGVTTTGEKRFTAKLEPSVSGHALVFTVKSLEIEGVSDALNRALAQKIPPLRLDLPDCAQGLRFENVRFAEKENAVNVTASVSGTDLFSLLPCLTGLE